MTNIDDAIEAGARVLLRDYQMQYDGGELDEFTYLSRDAIAAAWPILSAPLRETHTEVVKALFPGGEPRVQCSRCLCVWPCSDMKLITQTDKELGL